MTDNGQVQKFSSFWTHDDRWELALPGALAIAVLVHAIAFSLSARAPARAKPPPVEMSIIASPPRPPPPPPPLDVKPPETPPQRLPERRPKELPPPPNETPPPPDTVPPETKPVTGVTADSVVAEAVGGPQVREGNTTFGDPDKEKFTPPVEVQRPTAQLFDYAAYKETVFRTMDREKLYPRKARVLGLQGTCRVILLITKDGSLAAPPKLFASTGHEALDEECLRMARESKFPPVVGDTTFPVRINQPITFSLVNP